MSPLTDAAVTLRMTQCDGSDADNDVDDVDDDGDEDGESATGTGMLFTLAKMWQQRRFRRR